MILENIPDETETKEKISSNMLRHNSITIQKQNISGHNRIFLFIHHSICTALFVVNAWN